MTIDPTAVMYLRGITALLAVAYLILGYLRHRAEPMTRLHKVVASISFGILSGMMWSIPWLASLHPFGLPK